MVIQGRDFCMIETQNAVEAWPGSLPGHAHAAATGLDAQPAPGRCQPCGPVRRGSPLWAPHSCLARLRIDALPISPRR
jgi:hypothetical protein